jgi:hypothetical protein
MIKIIKDIKILKCISPPETHDRRKDDERAHINVDQSTSSDENVLPYQLNSKTIKRRISLKLNLKI